MIDGCLTWGISSEIALIWMSLDFTDDQSTLVQVMAWCRQATSHYLSQCWPRYLSPYGVTRSQWVNWSPLMLHTCIGELGQHWSCNGLLPAHCQAITWTNADLLLIGPLGTNFREIWIKMWNFSLVKIHSKKSSTKWQSFCQGGNELRIELTYQISKFSFSRNFHVLLSW